MSFLRAGFGEFQLKIAERDMLIGADLLQSATIIENVQMSVPSVTLKFLDDKRRAGSFGAYADSTPITVKMGDGKDGASNTWKFRQFSFKDAGANSAGELVTLTGVADLIPWFRKTIDKNFRATSSDAIKQLAQEHGISKVDVDQTDDKMNWLPDNRSIAQFARVLSDHSWAGPMASMFLALTSENGEWALRYKDIMKKAGSSAKTLSSVGMMGSGDFPLWDYSIASKSGFMNSTVNYGFKVVQENMKGLADVFDKLDVTKLTSAMGIMSSVAEAVGQARIHFMPAAVGNTHDKYSQALHANRKSRATFSTTLQLLTDQVTGIKLLDDVKVNLALSDGTRDEAYSGDYKVTGISRHMSKGAYVEKLVVVSQGQNATLGGAV